MDSFVPNVTDCALVFEGGGYRCAYTAGMADVLLEKEIYFPLVVGISAGASNTVNYLSQDRRRLRWALTTIAQDRLSGGIRSALLGHGYFNADRMYRGLINCEEAPFDFDSFLRNTAQARIQSFAPATGASVVWDKSDMSDVYELADRVRASSAVPWLMQPDTYISRVRYLDGGLGQGAGLPVHLAEQAGYHKFLFLSTRPHGYEKTPYTGYTLALIKHFTKDDPHTRSAILTRAERYNAERERIRRLEAEGTCLTVIPDEMPVSSTTLDVDALERAFDAGRAQALRELPRWRAFLFGSDTRGHSPQPPIVGGPGYIELRSGGAPES